MKIYQVDAFTDKVFSGNPAGVCLFLNHESDAWMQAMAREMNLSETAYLKEVDGGYHLRWFTPKHEVDLCGHATLAAAHVLWETGQADQADELTFFTRSGVLKAARRKTWIRLDFPKEEALPVDPVPELAACLNAQPVYLGKNRMDYLVEVESEQILRELKPDFAAMSRIQTRGVIVTAKSEHGKYDFVSRFFAPAYGISEDPVTGSAHCCLGPYWAKKLYQDELVAFQASERGGVLKLKVGERVYISGQAKTVFGGDVQTTEGEGRSTPA